MKQQQLKIKESGILFKYFEGKTNTNENELIMNWIKEDPDNKMFFHEVEQLWKGNNKDAVNTKYNYESAWNSLEEKAPDLRRSHSSVDKQILPKKNKNIKMLIRVAAVLVLLIAIWQALYLTRKTSIQSSDQMIENTMPDGSIIWLNKNTSVYYSKNRFNKKTRTVTLAGEAFFDIKEDKALSLLSKMRSTLPGYLVPKLAKEEANHDAKTVLG
jgi:ferric-dicitrate binding protein FerR (iron transport regulator)